MGCQGVAPGSPDLLEKRASCRRGLQAQAKPPNVTQDHSAAQQGRAGQCRAGQGRDAFDKVHSFKRNKHNFKAMSSHQVDGRASVQAGNLTRLSAVRSSGSDTSGTAVWWHGTAIYKGTCTCSRGA